MGLPHPKRERMLLAPEHGFHLLIVIVALIHEHEQHEVRTVKMPVAQPRPEAVITVDGFYLLVARGALECRGDLLSSFFGKPSASAILPALSPRRVL